MAKFQYRFENIQYRTSRQILINAAVDEGLQKDQAQKYRYMIRSTILASKLPMKITMITDQLPYLFVDYPKHMRTTADIVLILKNF